MIASPGRVPIDIKNGLQEILKMEPIAFKLAVRVLF